jgi:S1-C subfamily serine protease
MSTRNAARSLLGGLAALALFATALPSRADDQSEGLQLAMKIEAALTGVAEKASQAVVVITNKQKPGANQYQQFQQIPPEFRRFFGIPEGPFDGRRQPPRDDRPRAVGLGSGVLIRGDGYIVTNNHVIDNSDALEVRLRDGRVFDSAKGDDQVKIVGVDKDTDIAVLLIGGGKLKDLPSVPFGDSDRIRVGQYAIAVGAPFNLDYSVTIGHVSQKGRHGMRMTSYENYIQTDASINPGNSGGPLLNIHGEMIGINQFIMTGGGTSKGNIGLGFAIPSNLVNRVSADIIENGSVVRPFLGISMQPLTDVVTKIGDKEVASPHELLFAVLSYKPGDKVRLTVVRDGKAKVFSVVARKRDGAIAQTGGGNGGSIEGLGLTLQATDEGLVVTGIANGSPASRAEPELEIGDTIILVNGQKVSTHDDVTKALKKTKNDVVLLYVDRQQGGKYLIGIPLGDEK